MWRRAVEHACRLVGGPFDGDEGILGDPLPDDLWAYSCPDPDCPHGGVHWVRDELEEPWGERYRRGKRRSGVQLYVHAGLELEDGPVVHERELVAA